MSRSDTKSTTVTDYSIITESPGDRITAEAMQMLHTRYALAGKRCSGKAVLELGCGPALALPYLARQARFVVGGDRTFSLLRDASRRNPVKLPLLCLDAHCLPFAEGAFEVILLYEALYYLANPARFLDECRRVLKPGGELLVCLPNCEWPGFNPSPFSTRYFSAAQLYEVFTSRGFEVEVLGGFASRASTAGGKFRDRIRRMAVRAHVIPKTFKAKEKLKRLFYGNLQTIGSGFMEDEIVMSVLTRIAPGKSNQEYRVLYAIGKPRPQVLLPAKAEVELAVNAAR